MLNKQNLDNLVTEALAVEEAEAKSVGAIGFMARSLVQASMPHRKVNGNTFTRTNGLFRLTMLADPEIGLPFGGIPRLLLAWITTESVRTKERQLVLGETLTSFMVKLNLIPSGGKEGAITRLKEQMKRLFACSISCYYDDKKRWAMRNITPVSEANLWWDFKESNQMTLGKSTLTLNIDFFENIINNPVPIDIRVLKALKQSSLALDIYTWITYRSSYLTKKTKIHWATLQAQFGSNYSTNAQGLRDFKRAFLREFRKVYMMYQCLNAQPSDNGLVLEPSKPHISKAT